jgi:hypothetical protein
MRHVPGLIGQLYRTVRELHKRFPVRPFTLDGHLVGNIGEVVAAHTYGLQLTDRAVNPGFDAWTADKRTVEVKLTAGQSVWVSSDPVHPQCLVVLKYHEADGFKEVYCGEFPVELWNRKHTSRRLVKNLRLSELAREQVRLKPVQILRQKVALALLNGLFVKRRPRT